jgi:hypothetical protein
MQDQARFLNRDRIGILKEIKAPALLSPLVITDREGRKRSKIWDISPWLHCSVIGTCLTAGELRRLCVKFGDPEAPTASDHELHARAVKTASRRDNSAKILNKALDDKHEVAIKRFAKVSTTADLQALWNEALERGEIPGAYWALLTHHASSRELVQDAFGDVHMLSHMVGSSNRIDIAQLRQLEAAVAEREAKIARQQSRLQAAGEEKSKLADAVKRLGEELASRERPKPVAALNAEAAPLRRKLHQEQARSEHLHARVSILEQALHKAEERIAGLVERESLLSAELDVLERASVGVAGDDSPAAASELRDRRLLYVGGRPNQVAQLKAMVRRHGGVLMSHDGGLEDSTSLLPGMISTADAVYFPVDCISHRAALRVKELCRESGKPFVPLRSASLASFLVATARPRES